MGSPSAVISIGFGSWGSVGEVLTLGYGSDLSSVLIPGTPGYLIVEGSTTVSYVITGSKTFNDVAGSPLTYPVLRNES